MAPAWELTGRRTGPPLVPPPGIVERMQLLGAPLGVDPLPLLAERAAGAGFLRSGATTCSGAGRLLRAAGGWVAINLAREDDLASVAAWLELDADDEPWAAVASVVPTRSTATLVGRAELLGLPVAALGEVTPPSAPVLAVSCGPAPALTRPPVVVDLSSLWAGPLCTRLLADRGARVIKVESVARPDGARSGPRVFFERLHEGKDVRALDLAGPELRELLMQADVVVEASRPRALRALGIRSDEIAPRVWLSITGYGRDCNRVAFGDDAAVAGGLVAFDADGPCFVADAIADPLTGIASAVAIVTALECGGRWQLDASLAGVAAYVAGDDASRLWSEVPRSSEARR
jgi:hypothetical protein